MHAAVRAVVTISGSGFPSGCCVCWSLAISRSGRTGAALQGRVLLGAGGQAAPSACLTPPFRLRGFPAFPPQGRVLRVSASAGSPRSLPKAGFPAFPPQGRVPRISSPGPGSPRFRLRWFPAFPPQGRVPRVPSPGPASLPALLPRAAQHAGAGMGGPDAARCGPETQLRFPWAASCFRERPSLSVNSALLTTRFPP